VLSPAPVQRTLFEPPEPPSGPQKDVRRFVGSTYPQYVAWKHTEDGWRVWRYVERVALDLAAAGEERIGVKALVEKARQATKLEANNSWSCLLADDLVAAHPHLTTLIERRKRRKAMSPCG